MLPYATSERNEPLQITPWTNYALIAANVLVFLYELTIGGQGVSQLTTFITDYALVPCEYMAHCAIVPGTPTPFWLTLFTSMFLHGGWAHLLGNTLFLCVFGSHIERSMGHLRYLAFYLACGLGASGAISGVLAAYLLLYPTSSVSTLLPISYLVIPIRLPAWLMIAGWRGVLGACRWLCDRGYAHLAVSAARLCQAIARLSRSGSMMEAGA